MIFSRAYLGRTRIHPLQNFGKDWVVFRDDELSFSISGSKVRKYSTLLPYLSVNNYRHIVIIGGASSNNVCGLAQLVIEQGMIPHLITLEPRGALQGNALLSSLLVPRERWLYVARSDWGDVAQIAKEYASQFEKSTVIPEGANHPAAYPGALTLAEDIAAKCTPDHIFIDSGTGFQAKALVEGAKKWLPDTQIHVVLVAGEHFAADKQVTFYKPAFGSSFGSTPASVFAEIRKIAREEGFFVDPIYTAKLFATARSQNHLSGTKCIVHSGGGVGLFPYAIKVLGNDGSASKTLHNHT